MKTRNIPRCIQTTYYSYLNIYYIYNAKSYEEKKNIFYFTTSFFVELYMSVLLYISYCPLYTLNLLKNVKDWKSFTLIRYGILINN